jgi:MFS family permease
MLVSGGLALWLADRWLGWQGMYWLMAGLLIPVLLQRYWLLNRTMRSRHRTLNKPLSNHCAISLVATMPGLSCC